MLFTVLDSALLNAEFILIRLLNNGRYSYDNVASVGFEIKKRYRILDAEVCRIKICQVYLYHAFVL